MGYPRFENRGYPMIIHTGDDLLECKNFGVTSLNEVRERNLKLKNE